MPVPDDVRVSDADRERVARELREHFAAGRLSEEELNGRAHAAYLARTQAELLAVRADLPALPPTPDEERAELVERRSRLRRRVLQQSGGGLTGFAACTGVWLASGAHGSFWPAWVGLATLIPVLKNGWRLYGPAPELDEVERNLGRRRRERHRDRSAYR